MSNATTASLPRSRPSELGVPAAGIGDFLDQVQNDRLELHSLMVVQHGQVAAEGWWDPYTADGVQLLYSLSKSFTSTAIGLAIAEGRLSVDDLVISHFPELVTAELDERVASMRIQHLLSMATGHRQDTLERVFAAEAARKSPAVASSAGTLDSVDTETNLVRGFFSIPPDQDPGSVFAYNNSATYVLAVILQNVTGERLVDYLQSRLFEPLGISEAYWSADPQGRNLGFTGLHLTTESVAKLGQLYLQRGRWHGRQIVPEEWVAEATRKQISTADRPDAGPDWLQGYGYHFWLATHGYRGDGAFGQFCLVLPEQDAVIAITSATENMQGILDAVWDHLLPALSVEPTPTPVEPTPTPVEPIPTPVEPTPTPVEPTPTPVEPTPTPVEPVETTPEEKQLAKRLAHLSLPVGLGERHPGEDWIEAEEQWFEPADQPAGLLVPGIEHFSVQKSRGGWVVSLDLGQSPQSIACGDDRWFTDTITLPDNQALLVASTGGWGSPVHFCADIVFLQTPHRLRIIGDVEQGKFTLSWNIPPLGSGDLARLAAPGWVRP